MLTRIHTQNKTKKKKIKYKYTYIYVDIHIKKNCWIRGIHKNEFAAIHKSRIIRHRPFFFSVCYHENEQVTHSWSRRIRAHGKVKQMLLRRNSDWKSNFAFLAPHFFLLSLVHSIAQCLCVLPICVHLLKSSSHVLHIFGKTLRTHFKPYGRPYDRNECERNAKRKHVAIDGNSRYESKWIEPTNTLCICVDFVHTVRRANENFRSISNEM